MTTADLRARPVPVSTPSSALLPTGSLVLLVGLAAATQAQGGFYGRGQVLLGTAVAVALLVSRPRLVGPVPVAAGLLALWSVLAGALGGDVRSGARSGAFVLALAGVLALVQGLRRAQRQALVDAVMALGTVTALLGITGVAGHLTRFAQADQGLWRAATTLTYENAAAGLLAPLALVALATCGRDHLRAAAAALLTAGTVVTLSRAGVIALAVGGGFLIVRRSLPLLPVLSAAIVVAGVLPSSTGPAHPLLAVIGLLAGLAVLALPRLPRHTWVLLPVVGLAALLFGPHALHHRASLASSDRVGEAHGALRAWSAHPLTGVGPGTQALRFDSVQGVHLDSYAHDEYLQVLWKSGLVGLGLLLVLLVLVGRQVWRSPAVGCLAGLAALATASSFDFLWHVPLIPLVGAVLAGAASPPLHERHPEEHPPCTTS